MDGHLLEEMEKYPRVIHDHSHDHVASSNDEQTTKKSAPPLSPQEKKGILLLLILYTIQGLPLGFFGGAISLLLTEKGISMAQLAELSIVFYPFTFKFLFAPLQDVYFSRTFGKRKSYIIPLQYALAGIFLYTSFSIDALLHSQAIGTLVILGFIANFISSQQDVAVDGWVLTIFENEEHVNIGSTCNTIGQTLGILICNGLFIQINSTEFCNRFIFTEPQATPLVSASVFLQILAVVVFLVTLYVHLFVKEKESNKMNSAIANDDDDARELLKESTATTTGNEGKQEDAPKNVIEVLKQLSGFFTNRNLRLLLVFLLTFSIGVSPVRSSYGAMLMKQGMTKEFISSVGSLMIPIGFVAAIVASKKIRVNTEMNVWRVVFSIMVVESIIGYSIVRYYDNAEKQNSIVFSGIIIAYSFVSTVAATFRFVALGGLYNRISDEDLGGSSLTALNSFSNLGGQLSDQISLFLLSAFQYETIVAAGLIYSIGYVLVANKLFVPLQNLPKQAWSLHGEKQKPKQI